MSKMHPKWLWMVVGVEIVAIGSLLGIVLLRETPKTTPVSQQQTVTNTTPPTALTPPNIDVVLVASGLEAPTAIAAVHDVADKRLFVAEQAGYIRMIDASNKVIGDPVLDISKNVLNSGEQGLLGLAIHPDFKASPYFFIYYINKQRQSVLSRFEMDTATNRLKTGSEKVLLTLQQVHGNHKGGQVAFGSDGYLYFGLGDGGSANDPDDLGQNKNSWFGKILRLDVDKGDPYAIPATNPFKDDTKAKPEIWAYGLRNPWRFSFDRQTSDLYIADVGQNKYEEINLQAGTSKGGENYGWRCFEGAQAFNSAGCQEKGKYVMPIIEYAHDNDRCSVTGGYVYRGSQELALKGLYFYADYCTGELFYASKDNNAWKETIGKKTGHNISTFGEDSTGELYYADAKDGNIYRVIDTANN